MSKHRVRPVPVTERETVDQYLARGGSITRVRASLPNDLVRLPEHQIVDLLMGASYDDLFGAGVSRFNVSGDTLASIRESFDHVNVENEYAE